MGNHTRYIFIGGGTLIALVMIFNRKNDFMDDENKDFRDGFTAGFFTPGPFTILAIAGLAAFT